MNNETILPSLSLYRRNCHSSTQSHLCYLSSVTEIKFIEFTPSNTIKTCHNITIPLEPVKQIKVSLVNDQVYLAVAFITKFVVYVEKTIKLEYSVKLDSNIVEFKDVFIGVSEFSRGFIFVARNGDIGIYTTEKNSVVIKRPKQPVEAGKKYESFTVNYPNIYLGTEDGDLKWIVLGEQDTYEEKGNFETKSQLPILQLLFNPKTDEVVACTCEGELYVISSNLSKHSFISIHHSLVSRVLIYKDTLYTSGEDLILNKFEVLGNCEIKLLESRKLPKLVSLMFIVDEKVFITYYELPIVVQI